MSDFFLSTLKGEVQESWGKDMQLKTPLQALSPTVQ